MNAPSLFFVLWQLQCEQVSFGMGGEAENFTLYALRFGIVLDQK